MGQHPNFIQALRELAPTNRERARLLGVSERSIIMYLKGEALPHVAKVKRVAQLDEALTRDIRPETVQEPT